MDYMGFGGVNLETDVKNQWNNPRKMIYRLSISWLAYSRVFNQYEGEIGLTDPRMITAPQKTKHIVECRAFYMLVPSGLNSDVV